MTTRPTRRPRRPFLIVNPKSGGGKAEEADLAGVAEAQGIDVHVLGQEDDLREVAEAAAVGGADALGMAGGDGSLGLVADVAMSHRLPFVCLPAGTRNHFARDIGLDRDDLLGSLSAFSGEHRIVDAARIGSRVFLNNVTLGVYAEIVHEPGYRDNKLGTTGDVLPEMLSGARSASEMRFRDPKGNTWSSALVVLVSNNPYDLGNVLDFGVRPRLDLGCLSVTVIDTAAATEFAGVALSAMVGHLERSRAFHRWTAPRFVIESADELVPVGLDGEALELRPPLEFTVLPGALQLLVPAGTVTATTFTRKVFGRRTVLDLLDVARGRA